MFGRVPKNGAAFWGTRPKISEYHSEMSSRVPFCIAAGRPQPHRGALLLPFSNRSEVVLYPPWCRREEAAAHSGAMPAEAPGASMQQPVGWGEQGVWADDSSERD